MKRAVLFTAGMAAAFAVCAQDLLVRQKPIRSSAFPHPPGGANDILARIIGQKLSENLGQQIVIENRGGATGNIGAEYVAKAAPDGYTILMGQASNLTINVHLMKMPYDPVKDLAPVTLVATTPNLRSPHPSFPVEDDKGTLLSCAGESETGLDQLCVVGQRQRRASRGRVIQARRAY